MALGGSNLASVISHCHQLDAPANPPPRSPFPPSSPQSPVSSGTQACRPFSPLRGHFPFWRTLLQAAQPCLSLTPSVLPGRGWAQSILAPAGYNQILIIPSGATSIRVEEAAASRNFLGEWSGASLGCGRAVGPAPAADRAAHLCTAVKSIRGEYYLNGHWTIGGAWALPVASTVLHYERGAEGDLAPERLLARGPTSEPLVIEVRGCQGAGPPAPREARWGPLAC